MDTRKKFSREFKLEAVKMVKERTGNHLRRWAEHCLDKPVKPDGGASPSTDTRAAQDDSKPQSLIAG